MGLGNIGTGRVILPKDFSLHFKPTVALPRKEPKGRVPRSKGISCSDLMKLRNEKTEHLRSVSLILENGLQLRSGSSLRRVSADISDDILPRDKRCLPALFPLRRAA